MSQKRRKMGPTTVEANIREAVIQEAAEVAVARQLESERLGCLSRIPIIGWLITLDRVMSEEDR